MTQSTNYKKPLNEVALRDELRAMRTQIPDHPFTNPIGMVAFNLSRHFESGDFGLEDLKALSTRLMDSACVHRAMLLKDQIGLVDDSTTEEEFFTFITERATRGGEGEPGFQAFVERFARPRNGIVLTAHPTFGHSEVLSKKMAEIANSGTMEGHQIGLRHRPDPNLTLHHEHARAQSSIRNLRDAYFDLLCEFFGAGIKVFGERTINTHPQLVTFASWVGYDLDGRTDITWHFSLHTRLKEKKDALADIRQRVLDLIPSLGDSEDMQRLNRQLMGKLDLGLAAVDKHVNAVERLIAGEIALAEASNIITQDDGYNLVSIAPVTDLMDQIIAAVPTEAAKIKVAALRGLLEATGLGMSHMHMRVNAVQIHNAFRAFVHESWTRDLSETQALSRIVTMIKNAEPKTVNFETLDLESATAIRQFIMTAQILKHIDSETPIRYLIAECESPATILIAVYFAKLFGVADKIDISPLFETPEGLETGPHLIERLLATDAYRDYVQKRGRIAVQTGYSDAGRFIGQIAAGLSHERLHFGLKDVVRAANLDNVETLVFSTHGESMGRGAHPGPLRRRLRYLFSGEARWRFANAGLPIKHETSFQGGDGYLFFASKAFAKRTLTTVIISGKDPGEGIDPFYTDEDVSLDFQLRLRNYQQELYAHPGYRAVLGAFGANLLFKTGSRPVKRQGAHHSDRGDPARMRAIPNNAILQQVGYVTNVVAGLGSAAASDRGRFIEIAKESQRLKPLIEMIGRAKQLSSLNAVGANAMIFDAGFWAHRASWAREQHLDGAFKLLAERLLGDDRSEKIHGLVHYLRLDAVELHSILDEIGIEGGKIPDDHRLELDLLQAIRLALIMRIFVLAAQLPRFTPTKEATYEEIFSKALSLEIPEVIRVVREAFPPRTADHDDDAFQERATYLPKGIDDYGRIETEILKPMEEAYELVLEIGTGISHHWGAFG